MSTRVSASLLPRGFSYSAVACDLKKAGLDLGLIATDRPASAACVFTTNLVQAAPVLVSREHLKKSRRKILGVIVNSGNANCAIGPEGLAAAIASTREVAHALGRHDPSQILVCSTGVIGVPLRVEKILRAIPKLIHSRAATPVAFSQFSRAIMTTDTRPKWAAAHCLIGGKRIRVLGCCKGAGMIHPRMATMLAFIATDARVSPAILSRALRQSVARTFNSISIDGDTSTNDTVTLLANAASGAPPIRSAGANYYKFLSALESVCRSLALQIVADGEGARRVIEIEVRGAPSHRAAGQVARAIATSPLVKTALAGADPNWGRIIAAAGRSGMRFDPARVEIRMAGILMCRRGRAVPFNERAAHRRLLAKHYRIQLYFRSRVPHPSRSDEGEAGSARVWTCDFTADYVKINASYRT
ncbi:MAG TPA: bifunctional glutamate N-acetyltransferase/amino-acid acetyltransferase ArgJ [Candidatus Acidoferrales bacterium]|nr:bifunctional glutamate N-acetyltransferase/amino-acid acetyltransferase ArgJ [Candidatus Acidoferrales bacterium]